MFFYDDDGNIYLEKVDGIQLKEACISLPEPPEGYVGEIWIDKMNDCVMDDRERAYWYTYKDGKLVRHDWKKRLEDGEFTLEDFREKVLRLAKRTYQRLAQATDAVIVMYTKREALGLLEDGDGATYQSALSDYKTQTLKYRSTRDSARVATSIDELSALLPQ